MLKRIILMTGTNGENKALIYILERACRNSSSRDSPDHVGHGTNKFKYTIRTEGFMRQGTCNKRSLHRN
jgi:hypothetical protein